MSPDIQFGVVPALTTLVLLVIALVIYLLGPIKRRPNQRLWPVEYIYWVLGPFISVLARVGVTPNAVTTTSLGLAVLAGFALAKGWFFIATFAMSLTVFCDIIDGNLARQTGNTSKGGAFLDSFIDRLAEGALFLGIAYFGDGGYVTILAMLALITSFAVSYARARGESLGVDVKVGFAQRPVRMFILIFAILFSGISTWIQDTHATALYLLGGSSAIIALISAQTSFVRVRRVMSRLQDGDETKTPV